MGTPVILDTDIGTDVDDCLALALLLGCPELELRAVTCSYGDTSVRARMVRRLLRLAGRAEVPVLTGASQPLLRRRPVYWAGHEGVGLIEDEPALDSDRRPDAAWHLVTAARAEPGRLHLIAIGPLTTVALAFSLEPELPRLLKHLTIMGGVDRTHGRTDLDHTEHNIGCDPEAAHIVLSAGAPTTLVPLDVTTRVRVDTAGAERLRGPGTPFLDAVADQLARYPRFAEHGWTYLHDPLAVGAAAGIAGLEYAPMRVDVRLGDGPAAGATLMRPSDAPDAVSVATGVDAPAFTELFLARVTAPVRR